MEEGADGAAFGEEDAEGDAGGDEEYAAEEGREGQAGLKLVAEGEEGADAVGDGHGCNFVREAGACGKVSAPTHTSPLPVKSSTVPVFSTIWSS